jgi:hypothetical protein
LKKGEATQSEFAALQASIKDEGRSEDDKNDRIKFVKKIESLNIPFATESSTDKQKKEEELKKKAEAKERETQEKQVKAEAAKKSFETFASDPTKSFSFLQNKDEKRTAVEKFKQSKDPSLQAFAKKIEEDDKITSELDASKKVIEDRRGGLTSQVQKGISQSSLSDKEKTEATSILDRFKKGEIDTNSKELDKFGIRQGLTDAAGGEDKFIQQAGMTAKEETDLKNLKERSKKSKAGLVTAGKENIGAVNTALYKDQVAPGIVDMVKDPFEREKVRKYNEVVQRRQSAESEVATIDANAEDTKSKEGARKAVTEKIRKQLKTNTSISAEQRLRDSSLLTRFEAGEIGADDKELATSGLRGRLVAEAGGEENFKNLNKSGNAKEQQQRREEATKRAEKAKEEEGSMLTSIMPILEKLTGVVNAMTSQKDAASASQNDPDKKPEGAAGQPVPPTVEKREVLATINVNVQGPLTDSQLAQTKPFIVSTVQETVRNGASNSGMPSPNYGPPTATA